jgi:hypothetical protein
MIKSSACREESCVWVGFDLTQGRVLVAVAPEPEAIRLKFTPEEWAMFLAGAAAGEFNVERLRRAALDADKVADWPGSSGIGVLPAAVAVDDTDPFEDPAEDTGPPPFVAQFAGDCARCGARFHAGDEIKYDQGELIALECCGGDEA